MAPDAPATQYPARAATIHRKTKETNIHIALSIDGGPKDFITSLTKDQEKIQSAPEQQGKDNKHAYQESPSQYVDISTGIGFLDHMLHALAKHGGWSLYIRCDGDLFIDDHHTTEDVALALGSAFNQALTSNPTASLGLHRFGHFYAPLDEALSRAVIDLSARPHSEIHIPFKREKIGDLSTEMIVHAFQSFAQEARVTLHVDCIRGENDHHMAESAFKALAGAVRMACSRRIGVGEGEMASTKGVLY